MTLPSIGTPTSVSMRTPTSIRAADSARGDTRVSQAPVTRAETSVSFVIPARNEAARLGELLDSIRSQRLPDCDVATEVIVADARSSDATAEIARAAGCHVVTAPPGSAAAARNAGAASAGGQYLAFVDADCRLPADWLIAMLKELTSPGVVAAGSRMSPPESHESWVAHTWHALTVGSRPQPEDVDAAWLPSFNLAVRSDTFRDLGGFDESLTTCEDVDLSLRLNRHGRLRLSGAAAVPHFGSSQTVREFVQREAWRAGGTLTLLRRFAHSPREVLSTVIPWLVSLAAVTLPVALLLSAVLPSPAAVRCARGLAVGSGVFAFGVPALLALRGLLRGRTSLRRFPRGVALLLAYCFARTAGAVIHAPRRER